MHLQNMLTLIDHLIRSEMHLQKLITVLEFHVIYKKYMKCIKEMLISQLDCNTYPPSSHPQKITISDPMCNTFGMIEIIRLFLKITFHLALWVIMQKWCLVKCHSYMLLLIFCMSIVRY